ncbi:MAG: hybrid sensor histidine kinase/response regulator [Burkholderiales bacterium]|nr:hybrid sensor histidine kinase/response regulator [Burkholderiales bacterium]
MIVSGDEEPDDPALDEHRPATAQRGRTAQALLRALPLFAALVAGAALAQVALAPRAFGLVAWALAIGVLAGAVALLARRLRQRRARRWTPRSTEALVVASANLLALSWAAGLTIAPAGLPAAGLSAVLAMAGAALLAPMPWACVGAVLLPLLQAAVVVTPVDRATTGAAALVASAAAALLAWQGHASWRRSARQQDEQERSIRSLQAERDLARRADLDKSRFLAIASHDLRQPVHALGLFTATLQKRIQHSPEEPLVRNMARAIDGLERSFNAMLDITRLDAGTIEPRLETFALRDLFRRLHMHYAGHAELAGLGLRFSPGGKSVTSDPQLLERILGNLIQNAIKYTDAGGIVVVARSTASHINVEIWDTGRGVDAGTLPRIFDEFYQVGRGERDRTQGLGMGLAIVKRLARLLKHRLTVASRPGKGTMFRVGIAVGGLPGIQEAMVAADTVPMPATEPRTILVIEDEESIREGLRLLLEEWGYQPVIAASALQAEQAALALEGRVDLILSDLHLGDEPQEPDGLDAIDSVRRLCGHDVPAILVTGDTSHDQMRRVAASGHPVLFKPVQPRRLFNTLRALLS